MTTTDFGPAVVAAALAGLGGVMVKSKPVMAAPVDVEVVAPVEEVDAAGVGIPDCVETVAPLTVVQNWTAALKSGK